MEETISYTIRIPKTLYENGKKMAQEERRSFNSLIVRLLEKACKDNLATTYIDDDIMKQYEF